MGNIDNETKPQDTAETIRNIKQALHGMMNGPVSQSLREKGLAYKVIFGVEIPRLQEYAEELPHTHELAEKLWKEDIRECRILAAMLQPAETFYPEIADIWIESMRFAEEAEYTTMYLFQRLPYASQKAFEWIAREEDMFQLCGLLLLGRLLSKGLRPDERDEQEMIDQAAACLRSNSRATATAAQRLLMKFAGLGRKEERVVDKIFDSMAQ